MHLATKQTVRNYGRWQQPADYNLLADVLVTKNQYPSTVLNRAPDKVITS